MARIEDAGITSGLSVMHIGLQVSRKNGPTNQGEIR
jgi:hypothetical protein